MKAQTLPPDVVQEWSIGRAPGNDFVIRHSGVSGRHAKLQQLKSGACRLVDLNSTNGTYLGRTGGRITQVLLEGDEMLYFSPNYSLPVASLRQHLMMGTGTQAEHRLKPQQALVRIGRAPDNDVCLPSLTISRHHAEVRRDGEGRLWIRDLDTKLGTVVDQALIKDREVAITAESEILVGGCRISLDFSGAAEDSNHVAVERTGFALRVSKLSFELPGDSRRRILDGVSFGVYPGELVALMGPSGCGKSTLLNLLIGEHRPTSGTIHYDRHDLGISANMVLPFVAHVPQDDLLNPDLTVRETLRYYARVRLPADLTDREIDGKIDDVCRNLGLLNAAQGVDLRDRLIGSAEKKGLSGGQKKRVSMAMELLTDPRILFLDEPTSGLSSFDTKQVLEQMRQIASSCDLAIIVTIHQPSLQAFRIFDSVLYLKAGRLLYYGPSYPDSIHFFSPQGEPDSVGPDGVMEILDQADAEIFCQSYARSQLAARFVHRRLEGLEQHNSTVPTPGRRPLSSFYCQLVALVRKDGVAKLRDRRYLLIQALQPLVISLLVGQLFSRPDAASTATICFLVGLVSFWFGLNASIRELVAERVGYRRERRGGLMPSAYLLAKLTVVSAICGGQLLLLFSSLMVQVSELPWIFPSVLAFGMLVTSCGVALGLGVSAVSKTQLGAVSTAPLLLIPTILLAGFMKPYDLSMASLPLSKALADLTPLRWAFEGFCALAKTSNPCFFAPTLGGAILFLGGGIVGMLILIYVRIVR